MECRSCTKEITGNYIKVSNDKYHLNCFKCHECRVLLQDIFFLKNSKVLCQEHYSLQYSTKCHGCSKYILDEYLQLHDSVEKWHLECWKLFKIWDLKLENCDINYLKFKGILEILENFEVKTGEQVSKILVDFSHLLFQDVSLQLLIFLQYLETLYYSIYLIDIEAQKYQTMENTNVSSTLWSLVEDMTHKILEFMRMISKKDFKAVNIDKITDLVYSVKLVLRQGLKEAKRIEEKGSTDLLLQFIEWLDSEVMFSRETEDSQDLEGHTRCRRCAQELNSECVGLGSKKWHSSCLKCSICGDTSVEYFMKHNSLYCAKHLGTEAGMNRLRHVSRLEQYNYLLLAGLKRFCYLQNIDYPPKEKDVLEVPSNQFQQTNLNDETTTESSSIASSEECDISIFQGLHMLSETNYEDSIVDIGKTRFYISDLSGYKRMIANQMAAISLHSFLSEYFSLNELMSLVHHQKVSGWSKFLDKVRPIIASQKHSVKRKGYFGVALESQIEASGCTLNVGPRFIQNIRLPLLFRDLILALIQGGISTFTYDQDLSAEGIFRKNGNIKKLKALSKSCNSDPTNISLVGESSIQLAALMKKYLRELPDPLFTRKLYPAFIHSQKMDQNSKRLQALNLVLCLLPKANFEILQVLAWFCEYITTNFGFRNKMDVDNISAVLAPSILFSNTRENLADELLLSISVFKSIILHQNLLWQVPSPIANILNRLGANNDEDIDKNSISISQEIIKEYVREVIQKHD